jgi:SAM-dependent methyltransferase
VTRHDPKVGTRVIDLGCGIGRNSLYLAEQGYDVTAVDFSDKALEKFRQTLKDDARADHINAKQVNLAEKLPFANGSFDLAIDVVTTMTLTPDELPGFEAELRRILRPHGLFLTYVLGSDDGFLEATAPPGTASTTIEASGITDNYFSQDQLRRLYKQWEVLEMDKIEKTDHFYGKNYTRRLWWMLLRNSAK